VCREKIVIGGFDKVWEGKGMGNCGLRADSDRGI